MVRLAHCATSVRAVFIGNYNMNRWVWDRTTRLYLDNRGVKLTDRELREALDEYIDSVQRGMTAQVGRYVAGKVSIADLFQFFDEEITALHGASGSIAYGGLEQMGLREWDRVAVRLMPELGYMQRFKMDLHAAGISGEPLSAEGIANRAGLYAEAAYSEYMNQVVERESDNGVTTGRRICEADGASCEECVDAATEEFIPLSEIPDIGSLQCMCITTPGSRVLTSQGWNAIAAVMPGDVVLTHTGKWRRVLGVSVKLSTPIHKFVSVTAPTGAQVGFTDDHSLFTPMGFVPIYSIMQRKLSVYNWGHETLQRLRRDLCLREGEGLPSERMPIVRYEPESQTAMGHQAGFNHGGDYQGPEAAAHAVRGSDLGFQMGSEVARRTPVHMVLGRGSETNDLPLSVGMAQGARPDPFGLRDSSQERRPYLRPPVEPRTQDGFQAQDRTSDGQLPHTSTQRAVSDLRDDLSLEAAFTYETPEILQCEMRQAPVFLWDLEVAYDHSFIVEGIVAHNSNCRCEIEFGDETESFRTSELFSGIVSGMSDYGGNVEIQ